MYLILLLKLFFWCFFVSFFLFFLFFLPNLYKLVTHLLSFISNVLDLLLFVYDESEYSEDVGDLNDYFFELFFENALEWEEQFVFYFVDIDEGEGDSVESEDFEEVEAAYIAAMWFFALQGFFLYDKDIANSASRVLKKSKERKSCQKAIGGQGWRPWSRWLAGSCRQR